MYDSSTYSEYNLAKTDIREPNMYSECVSFNLFE